jgi:hypothetical protein
MWLLRPLLFRWLWDRLSGRQAQQRRSYGRGRETARVPWRSAPARSGWRTPPGRQRGRGGFWGPFPYYSRRTRGGSNVTVTGCCLPLALALFSLPVLALRAAIRR